MIIVQEADFDVADLLNNLRQRTAGEAGATASFIGYVRDFSPEAKTTTLFLEHYPGMCEKELLEIAHSAKSRWDILDYSIVHRVGALHNQDQIVFVAVASAHRSEAFKACEYIMDALKTRAPFWKKEILSTGQAFWVEQKESDTNKTESWNVKD